MENQTTEKVEVVEPVAAAPVATAKKTRMSNRTKNRVMFSVAVLAVALLAYNGGYLQKAGTKAQEAIAAITPCFVVRLRHRCQGRGQTDCRPRCVCGR